MVGFLDLPAEVRKVIYTNLFLQPDRQILGLSREPSWDYGQGPPDHWTASSHQRGLVYNSAAERAIPTNASFLRVSKLIQSEATEVFYGTNRIILYAEDNNDIFYWLIDIGEPNQRLIRHLEINWAYGVVMASGRQNVRSLLRKIAHMHRSCDPEVQHHREQLVKAVQQLEDKTVRLIIRTLNLVVRNRDLVSLAVYLPGSDGGNIWDIENDDIYFAEEIFSNTTRKVHACIPEALRKMRGLKQLTVGYTRDVILAEEIARTAGVEEIIIRVRPEDHHHGLTREEHAQWIIGGWHFEGAEAHKTLGPQRRDSVDTLDSVELRGEAGSDPGQLRSDMLVDF
ncbi:MAG: hypothetical protein M1827_003372 [Pycnora praestabilis]|nr:MAG: hypothetical protein M1827_003372 [Pycnora praestabilis]